jgi:hypothetical protein
MSSKRHTFKITFDNAAISAKDQKRIGAAIRKAALFEITELNLRPDVLRERGVLSCGGCSQCKSASAGELLRSRGPELDRES